MSGRAIAFIFARGGSRGIHRKNLALLAGKPLIAYSVETALDCSEIDRVFVSTEDHEIAETARKWGAEIPFLRPAALASDEAPEWLAWQHAVRWARQELDFEVFVSLPPTAPLRSADDVERCIRLLRRTDSDAVITMIRAHCNPYFNMVEVMERGRLVLSKHMPVTVSRRQDAPAVFELTTVAYAARPRYICEAASLFDGRVRGITVPEERSIDIDTPLDLAIAEQLIRETWPAEDGDVGSEG